MSTKCLICKQKRDGTYKGIICDTDGYLEGTGSVLNECYNVPKEITRLVSIGDIEGLCGTIEETREVSYGGMWTRPQIYQKDEFEADDISNTIGCVDYIYCYDLDHRWRVFNTEFKKWALLEDALKDESIIEGEDED